MLAQDLAGGFATRFTVERIPRHDLRSIWGRDRIRVTLRNRCGRRRSRTASSSPARKDGQFVVTRLSASGSLDPGFGTNGVAKRAFAGDAEARAVTVDTWGRILVAGRSSTQFAVACFSDSGGGCWFDSDAKITTAFPYPGGASAIAVGNDGRIVVGGSVWYWNNATSAKNEMFAVAATPASAGSMPRSERAARWCSTPGQASGRAEQGVDQRDCTRWQWSNRCAGTFAAKNVKSRFAVLRFLQNGQLDTTFGAQATGLVTTFNGCSWAGCFEEASASSLALQSDGKIVVAGSVRPLNSGSLAYNVGLVRLLSNGSRDVSGFGVDGYVRTDAGNYDEAFALKVAGASLFVAGHSGGQSLVARYSMSDGALDTDFGGGAVTTTTPCTGPRRLPLSSRAFHVEAPSALQSASPSSPGRAGDRDVH